MILNCPLGSRDASYPAVQGVAYGSRGTLDLPIGETYHSLELEVTLTGTNSNDPSLANLRTAISELVIRMNGRPQRICTGSELDTINTLKGTTYGVRLGAAAANVRTFTVPVYFSEPWRKSWAATEALAWPTAWQGGKSLDSFQLEVLWSAAITNVSLTSCKVYAITSPQLGKVDAAGNPLINIIKWRKSSIAYAGNGATTVTTFQRSGLLLEQNWFMANSDDITNMKATVDGVEVRNVTKNVNDADLLHQDMNLDDTNSPVNAYNFHLVFDQSDNITDGLNLTGVRDFQVEPTIANAAAAATASVISQVLGNPD